MKNYAITSLRLLLYVFPFILLGQDLPEIIPPSPTVANLMQFEEVPVSYYTGQPNITIPIYSKGLSGGVAMNVSLAYNTQGVKINNTSGWTGTSWSLMAGGSISRTVRGEPDEIDSGDKTGIYHLDDYWDYDNPNTDKAKFNFLVIGETGNKYDNKPDLYQFNFMGYSGRFVILKEGNTLVPKFISKSGKFKIEFTDNNDYEISAFKVTDPKGFVYTFDVVETSSTTSFVGSKAQGPTSTFNVSAGTAPYIANSAWHLSKVETSNGLDLATISYQDSFENYVASTNRTTNKITNIGGGYSYNTIVANSYNQAILEPAETVAYQNITSTTKKIDTITFVQDNTQVVFDMDMSFVHPETNGRALKTITIKNGSTINKTYNLIYDITTDTSLSPLEFKRIWLTKVTETAGSINLDYKLSYNYKDFLPGFNKDDIRGDSWGYYSGINLNQFSCTNTPYSDETIQTGLLASIEYPTGGLKEFEFEHNSYSYYQDQTITYDDYIVNPRNTSVQSQFTNDFTYNHSGQSAPTVTIDTFTLDFDQDIYVSSWMDTSPYLSDHIIKIYNGSYEVYVDLDDACAVVSNVPAGTYTMALAPYNNLNNFTYTISGDFQVIYTDAASNIKQEMIGGGVRIKEVRFIDSPITQNIAKKLKYVYDDETNSSLSSGVIDSKVDILEHRYQKNTSRHIFGNTENICHALTIQNIQYEVVEKAVNVELSQGSYVGYRHVKVLEENNGYSTFSYTSPYEYPTDFGSQPFIQPLPRPNLDYKRGLLLKQKVFNQSNQILKEVSYLDNTGLPNYDFDETFLFKDRNVFRPDCAYLQFYTDWTFYNNGTIQNYPPAAGGGNCPFRGFSRPCGEFPHTQVDFNSGWAKLLGTTSTEYFYDAQNNQSSIITRQEFEYNDDNYQISQQDTYYDKSGVTEHLQSKYYYPVGGHLGSNSTSMVNMLVGLNKVNEVMETQNFRNTVKLSETHTIYDDFYTDVILPKEIRVGKGTSTPETRIEFHKYDTYGNPLEVSKTDGAHISYIYGFNKSVPVAKLSNTTYALIESILGTNFSLTGNLSAANETSLINGLPNALMSFYRYDPMIGVLSTTDEKGYEMTYEYDALNRLIRVIDADGKIMGENNYFYQNQY